MPIWPNGIGGTVLLEKRSNLVAAYVLFSNQQKKKANGAKSMIERGAVDGVSHLFGVHLRPQEEIPFGKITPAIHHGAAVFLEGKITGVDAHGARPHQGKNALDPCLQFVFDVLQFSPFEAYSAKLTKVQAGGDSLNIIPGTATFAIDARSQSNAVLNELRDALRSRHSGNQPAYMISQSSWRGITIHQLRKYPRKP